MQKVLYIDKLDYLSLLMGVVSNFRFKRVYFHNAISTFQTKKSHKLLKYLGIHWISFVGLPVNSYLKYFQLNLDLGKRGVNDIFKKSHMYSFMIEYFNLKNIGIKKLEASLQRYLTSQFVHEGTSSIALIEYSFNLHNTEVTYMPSSLNNFVTACSLTQQNVRVISIHCFLIKILEVLKMGVLSLKHLSTYLWQKLNTKANGNHRHQTSSDVNVNDCTVAFFPHKSLRYGAFYNKTYLFENDPESLFYKKEVLTIFDDETDPVSQRFLRMHGIPNTSLRFQTSKKHLLNSMYNVWKATDKFKWLVDFGSIRKSISNLLILQFLISVELNCSRIRNLYSLKLAYFHYDILVSNALLLACHINSVTTVSMQDRTISSLWETGLIYDHYFIAGEGFKEIMEKRDYAIQQYHVVGMPRNKYIVEPHAKWKYQKYIDIKAKGLKLVVCFDIPPLNYFFEGLESETPSKKCIFDFYLSLIKLAEEFQDLYIVVKPKIQYTFANIFDKNTKAKVKSLNNFEVITDLKKYSPYVLAYYSDLIIGKHTSIMEEAFSVGKKIIFYDSEKYLTSTTHVVNNINIIVDNYNDLKKRVIDVMMLDQYIESNEWEKFNRHFFQGDSQQNGFGLIKQNLSEIYAGLELE